MLKKLIQSLFHAFGFQLNRLDSVPEKYIERIVHLHNPFTMNHALKQCKTRNLNIATVIDVGASNGCWSADCMEHYPEAYYYLIEAQEPHKPDLEAFKQKHNNVNYVLAAAGNKVGEIYFDNGGLFGGLASDTPLAQSHIVVPVTTIDTEVKKHQLKAPYLVKLDTHGYEVPILEGAAETLKNANLVIIETYNFKLTKDSLRFWEMCNYMSDLGFQPIDMVDFMHRKKDGAFWQMDTFFIKKDSIEFSSNSYE
jgi:FkbM family methyltransferase